MPDVVISLNTIFNIISIIGQKCFFSFERELGVFCEYLVGFKCCMQKKRLFFLACHLRIFS